MDTPPQNTTATGMETTVLSGSSDAHGMAQEEWVITTSNGLVTKIQRIDPVTTVRAEISAEEYAAWWASYATAYYMGIRDYSAAVAAGNLDAAHAYYQGMTQYLAAIGQM